MMPIELQKDELGRAKLCSITDLQVCLASNKIIIEQFDAGQYNQLRTVLPAQKASDLAATLKKAAKLLLEPRSDTIVN